MILKRCDVDAKRRNTVSSNYKSRYLFWLCLFPLYLSCFSNGEKNSSQIVYWSANNPDEIIFARAVVEQWNQLNPHFIVKFQPVPEGRSSEEIILAAVVGKTTPDIYSNMWQGDVEFYAQSGTLVPLDTITGFLEFIYERCDSATVEEVTSADGHIYQIPWKINPIMLLYNRNIMNKLGYYNPPSTYGEYLDAAKKFQKDADNDGYVDRWIGYCEIMLVWYQRFFDFYPLYLAASGGGPLVKNNEVMFNNDYAIETFRFLKTLYEKNYLPRERLSARSDAFLGSEIATRFAGPWEIAHAEKFKTEGFEYSFASMPVPDGFNGPVYTYCDPKNIVLFNTCQNPELAWKFLAHMLSKENDLEFLKITSQLPRRRSLFTDEFFADYFKENPKMIPFAKQAQYIRGTDSSPVLKEIFDVITQEYEACVVYGTKSPEKAIQDAADAAQLLLN
ncbi:MAG: extracellular solute-binding protein [bacterium]|nr:MAG: extracellular solute-binding protein [bacterium]